MRGQSGKSGCFSLNTSVRATIDSKLIRGSILVLHKILARGTLSKQTTTRSREKLCLRRSDEVVKTVDLCKQLISHLQK